MKGTNVAVAAHVCNPKERSRGIKAAKNLTRTGGWAGGCTNMKRLMVVRVGIGLVVAAEILATCVERLITLVGRVVYVFYTKHMKLLLVNIMSFTQNI